MNNPLYSQIAQATSLTRAGRLKEATQLIQQTLQQFDLAPPTDEVAIVPSDEIIDVDAEVINEPINSTGLGTQTTTPQSRASNQDQASSDNEQRIDKLTESHQWFKSNSTPLQQRLRQLKNLFPQLKTQVVPKETSVPQTKRGQFIEGYYSRSNQTRRYKQYIPSGYKGQALPLVVMLHGCTQSPDDFAIGTRMNLLAEEELFMVVYPAQEQKANGSLCWNWFEIGNQQHGRGEPSIIAGITEQVVSNYGLDKSQVYVSGLSAGGAMAVIMGICYPDVYAAVGIHSGLPYGVAKDLQSAFAAMHNQRNGLLQQKDKNSFAPKRTTQFVPIIVFHGDRDTTVHPNNSEQIISQWALIHSGGDLSQSQETMLRVRVMREKVTNGHAYSRFIYCDLSGSTIMERWLVHGAGHGWSGGSSRGSFTDVMGPDASQEMLRFFKEHSKS